MRGVFHDVPLAQTDTLRTTAAYVSLVHRDVLLHLIPREENKSPYTARRGAALSHTPGPSEERPSHNLVRGEGGDTTKLARP